jgi:3-oxoacyl-[acyl-carrier protein] reductase
MLAAVLGASGAIGSEICRCLANRRYTVAGTYCTRPDRIESLARELQLKAVFCDVAEQDGPAKAYDEIKSTAGAPAVVVLSAGQKLRASALLTRAQEAELLFRVNVIGQIEFARLALKDMMKARFGRIVLIGSQAGSHGLPGQAAYAASKASLAAWAASVAGEVGRYSITVNTVAPGAMEDAADTTYSPAERSTIVERIACGRLGSPREVAEAVAFLVSGEAAYINGVTLPVDGGARF